MFEKETKETTLGGRPARCRGRGKRLAATALVLGILAVLSVGALRAFGQGPRWMIHGQKKLTEIAQAALADLAPLHAELRANRAQAATLLTQETIDRAALEALRVKQVALVTTASTRLTKVIADAAEVLTPAQRLELAKLLERHWS